MHLRIILFAFILFLGSCLEFSRDFLREDLILVTYCDILLDENNNYVSCEETSTSITGVRIKKKQLIFSTTKGEVIQDYDVDIDATREEYARFDKTTILNDSNNVLELFILMMGDNNEEIRGRATFIKAG